MYMGYYGFILGILSTWRITHFLRAEDGPGDSVVWLRKAVGEGFFGSLLDCFYCLSVWIAFPFAVLLGESRAERFLLWLSLSAGAILLERITERPWEIQQPPYLEEHNHELLWKKESDDQ
jgi:hypothetical protein